MKNALKLVMLIAMLSTLAVSAALAGECDDPLIPENDVINRAIVAHIGKVGKLVSYKEEGIECKTNKKGLEIWTIDYTATIEYTPETAKRLKKKGETYKEKVRIAYEGDQYYMQ